MRIPLMRGGREVAAYDEESKEIVGSGADAERLRDAAARGVSMMEGDERGDGEMFTTAKVYRPGDPKFTFALVELAECDGMVAGDDAMQELISRWRSVAEAT